MKLTQEELQFLNSLLSQVNPQGLKANVTRIQIWTKVQQNLQEMEHDQEQLDVPAKE